MKKRLAAHACSTDRINTVEAKLVSLVSGVCPGGVELGFESEMDFGRARSYAEESDCEICNELANSSPVLRFVIE